MKIKLELEAIKLEMELPLAVLLIIKQYIDLLCNGKTWKETKIIQEENLEVKKTN